MIKPLHVFAAITLLLASCGGNDSKAPTAAPKSDSNTTAKETPAETPAPASTERPPIINITDTLSVKRLVIYMKDSAATPERLALKVPAILGFKLDAVIKKNKLTATGRPMVWYKTSKPPYFFEAGIPVDKKPAKQPSNVYTREMGVDSVTVAHFYGGYNLLPQAYEALNDWMKSHKKKLKATPYEIYVDDSKDASGKPKDPYKVQTDVIYPW